MVEETQYKWNRTEEHVGILCVQWALHDPSALVQVKCSKRKQFTCPQAAPIPQAVSFLGCSQGVGGWNNSCHRHLEKPTGNVASAEVTLASVLPRNTGQFLGVFLTAFKRTHSHNYLPALPLNWRGKRGKTWGSLSDGIVSFTSSIISSTSCLSFAAVSARSGCCKTAEVVKILMGTCMLSKLILPALTWRGMLSTITCGRVMTVLTTGTLSTGELLQAKNQTQTMLKIIQQSNVCTPKEHHL